MQQPCASFKQQRLFIIGLLLTVTGPAKALADDWPQWLGPRRDGVWRETGILERFPPEGPKVRWRHPVGGGYSGPAVAAGKVFITDRVLPKGTSNPKDGFDRNLIDGQERVLCLDETKGKELWHYAYDCPYQISY